MDEYKGNSHLDRSNARPEVQAGASAERRVERAVVSATSTQRRSQIARLSEVFFARDIRSVCDYLKDEWLIPAVRQAIWEFLTKGLSMTLFGEPETDNRRHTNASRVSYWQPNNVTNIRPFVDRRDERREPMRRVNYSYDDILFANRGEAELALDKMYELLQRYSIVRVADLFELADLTCASTDYAYGWTDLSSVRAVAVQGGKWTLRMPRAMPLD